MFTSHSTLAKPLPEDDFVNWTGDGSIKLAGMIQLVMAQADAPTIDINELQIPGCNQVELTDEFEGIEDCFDEVNRRYRKVSLRKAIEGGHIVVEFVGKTCWLYSTSERYLDLVNDPAVVQVIDGFRNAQTRFGRCDAGLFFVSPDGDSLAEITLPGFGELGEVPICARNALGIVGRKLQVSEQSDAELPLAA